MADVAFHLAEKMAAEWRSFELPPAAADALDFAVSNWRTNTPDAQPLAAPLREQLDAFLSPPDEEGLFGVKMKEWRRLPWRPGGGGKAAGIAVVELVGPDGLGFSDTCRAGVLFQDAGYFYPWHRHAAEEFYLPVSGAAKWMVEGKEPEVIAAEEKLIHHREWQPHALETDAKPLLALWMWTGDLGLESYEFLT